jgi:hypothetical protein
MPETITFVEPEFRFPIRSLGISEQALVPESPEIRSLTVNLSRIRSSNTSFTIYVGMVAWDEGAAAQTVTQLNGSWLTGGTFAAGQSGLSLCHYMPLDGSTAAIGIGGFVVNDLTIIPKAVRTESFQQLGTPAPAKRTTLYSYMANRANVYYKFKILLEQWRKETRYTSSFTQMMMSSAYQKIIGMGPDIVPLILREIEGEGDDPDHWGWALSAITDEDPVPASAAGDTVKIAKAWLSWGRARYAW